GCGDRHCPTCQQQRSRDWLQRQRGSLLPVRYFHWVFTLPAALRPLALQNQSALYQALFDSASATLLQFGQERFQAELGITAILHTWGQKDRRSTRLNSSHQIISYAVFCLKKKKYTNFLYC